MPGIGSFAYRTTLRLIQRGERWVVRWTDPDDRDREKWFPTKTAATAHGVEMESQKGKGTYADPRKGQAPLRQVADEWLNSLTRATPRTRAEYQRLLETRVLPHFGPTRPIATIRRPDVTAYLRALTEEGLRPQTIGNAYAPLRATLTASA